MAVMYDLQEETQTKIGLIVLQADETIEGDMRRLLPQEIELLISRVPSGTEVTPDTLRDMAGVLTQSAALFPSGIRFSVVGYGCTSGTAEIGVTQVARHIRAGTNAENVTEPVSALVAACRALDVQRLGLLSPYVANVSDRLRSVLSTHGIDVTGFASFEEPNESKVARIAPASIAAAAIDLARETDCDAIFMSCTNLRTLDIIDQIEQDTGLPVFSSNQVLAWHLLQQCTGKTHAGPGRLWYI